MRIEVIVAVEDMLLVIFPEMCGVVVMGNSLTEIAKPEVKSLFVGCSSAIRPSQSPFADGCCYVTGFLQESADGDRVWQQGSLPFQVWISPNISAIGKFIVITDVGMPSMLSCQEHTPGRCTHRAPGIVLCEPHPLSSHLIEIWSPYLRLSIRAQFSITQIIGENKNDVGFRRALLLAHRKL
jgi:hypothetical protein